MIHVLSHCAAQDDPGFSLASMIIATTGPAQHSTVRYLYLPVRLTKYPMIGAESVMATELGRMWAPA